MSCDIWASEGTTRDPINDIYIFIIFGCPKGIRTKENRICIFHVVRFQYWTWFMRYIYIYIYLVGPAISHGCACPVPPVVWHETIYRINHMFSYVHCLLSNSVDCYVVIGLLKSQDPISLSWTCIAIWVVRYGTLMHDFLWGQLWNGSPRKFDLDLIYGNIFR